LRFLFADFPAACRWKFHVHCRRFAVALQAARKFKTFMHFLMRFKRVGLVSVLVFHSSISAIAAAKVQSVLIMPFICNLNESPSPSLLFFFF